MTSTDLSSARCASRGVVGTLLREAVAHFNGGTYKDHALKMLGVSLHTIQDFYSHRVDIYDARYHQTLELRAYAEACGVIVFKMEDDPKIAPERWHAAKLRTEDQLRAFKTMVNAADLAAF